MAVVESLKINQIKEERSEVGVECMIRNVEEKIAKNSNPYLEIEIMDNTGSVKVRCFDMAKYFPKDWNTVCYKSALVKVLLDVKLFNGSLAPNLVGFRALTEKEIEKNGGMQGFIYSVEEDTTELLKELEGFIKKTGKYKDVVNTLFKQNKEGFIVAPASKIMHHNCFGGLLYHTVSMLRTATQMGKIYPLDMELLYSGIILHDMMKIEEIGYDEFGSPDATYKKPGFLIGHIGLISMELTKTFEKLKTKKDYKLKEEDEMLLYHMILAHHEKLEWGSPIRPCIPEAIAIAFIDNFDAKMWTAFHELNMIEEGTLSPSIKVFGHGLYKRLSSDTSDEPSSSEESKEV